MMTTEEYEKLKKRADGAVFMFKMFLFVVIMSGVVITGMSWWVSGLSEQLVTAQEELDQCRSERASQ